MEATALKVVVRNNKVAVIVLKAVVVIKAIVHKVDDTKVIVQTIVLVKQVVEEEMFLKLLSKKRSIKKLSKIRSKKLKLNYLDKEVEVRA